MSKWVKLSKKGKSSSKVIPVNVPATPENAALLDGRLQFLRDRIVAAFQQNELKLS
jgi:hypothetical protein